MDTKPDILDWLVPIKNLVRNGMTLNYQADDKELEAIKLAYDLVSAKAFGLKIDLRQNGRGMIAAAGKLTALVEQACVVTLEPVEEKIDISFDRLFFRERDTGKKGRSGANDSVAAEVVVEPFDEDPPDILRGNAVNLGEMSLEEFSLVLNPYPRHHNAPDTPSAAYPERNTDKDDGDTGTRPFAILGKFQAENPDK